MTQTRFNSLVILHIHKDRTDQLNLIDVANEFVARNDNRKRYFGKFSAFDDNIIKNDKFYFLFGCKRLFHW